MRPKALPLAVLLTALATPALAGGLTVRFIEGAPTDRFEIINATGCETGALELRIDLTGSAGGLIFDTTATGAGVSVFQPFRVAEGPLTLASGTVKDGDRVLVLSLAGLRAGERAAFTIDVDDTLVASDQTRVSAGEMAGARIGALIGGSDAAQATFGTDNQAVVPFAACFSRATPGDASA